MAANAAVMGLAGPADLAAPPAADGRRPVAFLLAHASLALIYAAVYLKDVASAWVGAATAGMVLGAGLALGAAAVVFGGTFPASPEARRSGLVLVAWLSVWLATLLTTGTLNTSSYYVAIPCAAVIMNMRPQLFLRLLWLHLIASIAIQAGEYVSGQYLFVYQADDGTALDETLFGGGLDVFRAKGLFQGPLSAVAFALWMAFVKRGRLAPVGLLFLSAFFASGRLGMLTSIVLGLFRGARARTGRVGSLRGVALLALSAAAAAALLATSDANRLLFISSALDLDNDQNVSRVYFWLISLAHYANYSPLEMLFGRHGFIVREEGGTENDFLRLLLDCGLLGCLLYVAAIVAQAVAAWRRGDREGVFIAMLTVVLMNIFPFVQSLSSALLFWIHFFYAINRAGPVASPERRPKAVSP